MKRSAPMQRTEFKRSPATSKEPMGQVGLVAAPRKVPTARKPMKSKKITPTAAESRWMAAVAELGCIVCLKFHQVKTPCAVHHIVEGSRRVGHMFTIGLCDPGHHQNTQTSQKISRHPDKKRFEKSYGSEYELLEYTQKILKGGSDGT